MDKTGSREFELDQFFGRSTEKIPSVCKSKSKHKEKASLSTVRGPDDVLTAEDDTEDDDCYKLTGSALATHSNAIQYYILYYEYNKMERWNDPLNKVSQ